MELKDITKEATVVTDETTLEEALKRMLSSEANAILVINEEGVLCGEVTISDIFDGVIPFSLDGDKAMETFQTEEAFIESLKNAKDTAVSEFMSTDFSTVYITDSIMDVAATAIAHHRSQIPVVDHDGHPIGIISRRGLKQILHSYLTATNHARSSK